MMQCVEQATCVEQANCASCFSHMPPSHSSTAEKANDYGAGDPNRDSLVTTTEMADRLGLSHIR
jgi:hypothetical protein